MCKCESQRESAEAASNADERAFGRNRGNETPAGHAQHAQERELRAPPHDGKRLRGEHEQPPGEERDQRQHVEIDAVRAREAGAGGDARLRPFRGNAGRQDGVESTAKRIDVDAGREAQIDAGDASEPIELGLRAGDVHHSEALLARRQRAGNAQGAKREPHLERHDVAGGNAEPARRCCAYEQRVGAQRIETIGRRRDQCRLDPGYAKRILAQDAQRIVAAGELRVDLDYGARDGDLGHPRDCRIEPFVESGPRAAHFQIRVPG